MYLILYFLVSTIFRLMVNACWLFFFFGGAFGRQDYMKGISNNVVNPRICVSAFSITLGVWLVNGSSMGMS